MKIQQKNTKVNTNFYYKLLIIVNNSKTLRWADSNTKNLSQSLQFRLLTIFCKVCWTNSTVNIIEYAIFLIEMLLIWFGNISNPAFSICNKNSVVLFLAQSSIFRLSEFFELYLNIRVLRVTYYLLLSVSSHMKYF